MGVSARSLTDVIMTIKYFEKVAIIDYRQYDLLVKYCQLNCGNSHVL